MHFQQSVPEDIRILASNLQDIPTIATQSKQTRSQVVALGLVALLALPILQALGELCGLQPFLATCVSLGAVIICAIFWVETSKAIL
ncbi:uncharacterized protein GGS25DRAFT_526350 [Hypoxylon fragiforme]|uniref:uncharacterized protein n=1 Tax=Hypoxylon fragiforme TaxID=63214 RepID=UPI0020C5CAC5|nr:uncharacterized protein GGS25DRAFT_526350 [Hypoxylon fragiforme]KAI2603309.1 hypothetical protein GGS25DRAFT_526350 [Hypoxylon fragiforme]